MGGSGGELTVQRVPFRNWVFEADVAATQTRCAALPPAWPGQCTCDHCFNFEANRDRVYSEEVLTFFGTVGLSPARETEVYHICREPDGRHLYGGWLNFVGRVISGADCRRAVGGGTTVFDLYGFDSGFEIGFSSQRDCIPPDARDYVQVEFLARLPWTIDAPEPE